MSAGLLGALAGVGPGVQSGLDSKENRASSKSERVINEAVEGRNAERHQWAKGLGDRFRMRNMVDDPEQWRQFFQGAGPVAPTPQAMPPVQQALPGIGAALNPQPLPEAQDGGPMEVPAQAPAQGPQALPAQAPAPQGGQDIPDRRARYNQWYNETARYAALTGGLEGYQKFQEMENATSRRQVLGYALQAVRSMDEGNVGEAMRAGNASLEVTPFDTGLKFEAINGNLHMVGADGKPGKPLTADHLRAFAEDHMKTPESYLAWKEQYEKERSNLAIEGIKAKEAETSRRQADQWVKEGPGRDLLRKAQSYAALASGEAALLRAEGSGSEEQGLAWSEENMLKIEEMERTAMEGGLGFGGKWSAEGMMNSQLHSDAIAAAVETRIANNPAAMTHNDAATLSRMAYFPMLQDDKGGMVPPSTNLLSLLRETKVFTDDDGNYMVDYKGKQLLVPPHVGSKIHANKRHLTAE